MSRPALALLQLLEALAQLGVAAPERAHPLVDPHRVPLALDERMAHEELARGRPVDAGELHTATRDDLEAEQRHLLERDGGAGILSTSAARSPGAWRGLRRAVRPTPGRWRRPCARTCGRSPRSRPRSPRADSSCAVPSRGRSRSGCRGLPVLRDATALRLLRGGVRLARGAVRSSRRPICDRSPDSRARWMASGSLVPVSSPARSGVFTSVRSWRCTSNHSRTRT